MTSDFPQTPTLEKIKVVHEQSQAIGEFLEWLQGKHIALCEYRDTKRPVCPKCEAKTVRIRDFTLMGGNSRGYSDPKNSERVCKTCLGDGYLVEPSGYYPTGETIDNLLHLYFGIDTKEEERERRAVLDYIKNSKYS